MLSWKRGGGGVERQRKTVLTYSVTMKKCYGLKRSGLILFGSCHTYTNKLDRLNDMPFQIVAAGALITSR